MLILKGLIVFNLGYIMYQDVKSREVYWFLLPALIFFLGYLHYRSVLQIHFLNAVLINAIMVSIVLSILYLYTIVKIKKPFFKEVFGPADALCFLALAVAFPTITFTILFVFSILFSLFTWLILKRKSKHISIPLAGYMSAFLLLIFVLNWITNTVNLYLI